MSKERCQATKQLLKHALDILGSGAAGQGRGIRLALERTEDAFMRVDFHMKEKGWNVSPSQPPATKPVDTNFTNTPMRPQTNSGLRTVMSSESPAPPLAQSTVAPLPKRSRGRPPAASKPAATLAPAEHIPRLRTGLMDTERTVSDMDLQDATADLDSLL